MKLGTFTKARAAAADTTILPAVLTTALVLYSGAIVRAQTYHPQFGNYSVTIVSGPIDTVGFNGGLARFTDSNNALSITSSGGTSASLDRAYDFLFTPDPGFQFTGTVGLVAHGNGRATTGVFSEGPITYTIAGVSGELTPHSFSNPAYNYSSEINFARTGITSPTNAFHFFLGTSMFVATDVNGGFAEAYLGGNSTGAYSYQVDVTTIGATPAPEPVTLGLLLTSMLPLAGAMIARRRRAGRLDA